MWVDFLKAQADPEHERHDKYLEWAGPFDPEAFDAEKRTSYTPQQQCYHCLSLGRAYVGTMTAWKDTAMVMPANPTPNYPTTVDEAVDMIVDNLTDAQKDEVRKISLADLHLLHFGLGTVIRNQCGLWEGNTVLLAACGSPYMHPDEASNVIVRALWERLRG